MTCGFKVVLFLEKLLRVLLRNLRLKVKMELQLIYMA